MRYPFNISGLVCVLLISAFVGCTKEKSPRLIKQEVVYSKLENSAIQAANVFRKSLLSGETTKSNLSSGIESVSSVDLPFSFPDELSRDSVYVVSYTDNNGFSIVVSNEYSSDVLVSTEAGALDSSKLFNDHAEYDFDGEEIMYKYVESLLYKYETDETCRRIKEPATKLNPGESYNVWYTDTLVQPIVHFKWGQSYPFNMSMPNTPDTLYSHGPTSNYRGKYAVGCTIIAAMQMAAATCHPSSITPDSYVYYLSQFSGVSMYYNYEDFMPNDYDTLVSPQLKIVTNKLAYLLRWFGDSIGAENDPEDGGTSASNEDAMTLLSSLDNARYGNWGTTQCPYGSLAYKPDIYAMLDLGKPIMIRGEIVISPDETEGHAWLIDGYISQHMTRPDDDEYHRHYVHFNWGWRGMYDGYYSSTNISGRIMQDSIYDTNTEPAYLCPDNYCLNTMYYPY